MNAVFLGIGANVDDRLVYINKTIRFFRSESLINLKKISPIYESKPYGIESQKKFLNLVVEIRTSLNLIQLFTKLKDIELKTGRKKTFQGGPREIDIDILLFNDITFSNDFLTVPHKDMINRDFVLKPLLDIRGSFLLPGTSQVIDEKFILNLKKYTIRKIDTESLIFTVSN